jgi:hypothetical protein
MKRILLICALGIASVSAMAQDVGVSIRIGDPNFYGRIDIGNAPRPQVIYTNPVIIHRPSVGYVEEPVYLRVPPGHAKNWGKHCKRYDACGRRVYFVQDNWYSNVYAPRHREHDHDGDRDRKGNDHDRGNGHGHGNKHDRK